MFINQSLLSSLDCFELGTTLKLNMFSNINMITHIHMRYWWCPSTTS